MSGSACERVPIGICSGEPRLNTGLEDIDVFIEGSDVFEWRPFCRFDPGTAAAPSALTEPLADLCGYVLTGGADTGHDATAAEKTNALYLLPVEQAEHLRDTVAREHFLLRVLTVYRWRSLVDGGLSVNALQRFYARHKYLVMSRDVSLYRRLGALLANTGSKRLPAVAAEMIGLIMAALERPASRAGDTNALLHIRGYLKHHLSCTEQAELSELIERYRLGAVPLSEPLRLLREHFHQHPDDYIDQQIFLRLCAWTPTALSDTS